MEGACAKCCKITCIVFGTIMIIGGVGRLIVYAIYAGSYGDYDDK